jgi:hypothetical protein
VSASIRSTLRTEHDFVRDVRREFSGQRRFACPSVEISTDVATVSASQLPLNFSR